MEDISIAAEKIPTVFHTSADVLKEAVQKHRPDIIICTGQVSGRPHITPERVAINIDDARIADNEGRMPIDQEIVQNGPAAYWSTLPIKRIVKSLRNSGIPSICLKFSGHFCLQSFILSVDASFKPFIITNAGGFIHIPYLPEQTVDKKEPSLSLETIVEGLRIAAVTAASHETDIREPGGSLD
ncbi:pyroglutamyl-peptidase I [Bacillus sonorensis]|nr:pyroglutamyl-peptidase I [Bacillus sonorensis]